MMKINNEHLIPQAVIDCGQNFINTKPGHVKTNYEMRLEAIRDYCDNVLKTSVSTNNQTFNNNKGKYARVGM